MSRFLQVSMEKAKATFCVRLSYVIHAIRGEIPQSVIAAKAGCSASSISAIACNKLHRVSLATLLRVADALKMEYTVTLSNSGGRRHQEVQVESAIDYERRMKRPIPTGARKKAKESLWATL